MPNQSFFRPGQTIVIREMCDGRIWEARPAVVVSDTPRLGAFFVPPGSIWKESGEDFRPAERVGKSWRLKDKVWGFGGILRLTVPAASYSVLLLRNADGSLYQWYINLEDPLRRTGLGFDYEDNILDIGVNPDFSGWHWKDEDELQEAIIIGLISQEKAAALYTEGKKAVDWLISGQSPFNGWEKWRPDPAWTLPVFPEGWEEAKP
ncbi:MAG: DUF402 domain-containing protein [Dehalococcoidales bacterium]|jgi:hypothetical protein